jgi:hypothetical protein
MRVMLLAIAAVLAIAPAARACDTDECYTTVGLSCPGMQITACPGGDFEMIKNGCGSTGGYIWVDVRDGCNNNPMPGIPYTDFWINACDPTHQLSICAAPIIADSITGTNGRTTFSGILKAGGCVPSGGIWIAVQGKVIKGPYPSCTGNICLPIVVKSPDLTGAGGKPDGFVNLSDLIPFGFTYNKNQGQAGYNECCNYNDDYKCNLSDFAYFGTHYQHSCI